MGLSTIFNAVLVLFSATLFVIFLWAKRNANYWKRHGVPHTVSYPLLGNFIDIVSGKRGLVEIFNDLYYDKKSENSPIYGCNLFHNPSLLIKDPELIKRVLIKDFSFFTNRYGGSNLGNDKLGGSNLFFLKGLKWKNLRAKLTPTFSNTKLKQMFYLKAKVGEDLGKLMKTCSDNKNDEIDVYDVAVRYTTDVIATCAFGIEANSLSDPDSEFRRNGKRIFETTFVRAIEFLTTFYIPQLCKIFNFKTFSKETTTFFKSVIPVVMDEREKTGITRNDLLDTLISFRKQYRDEQANNVKYSENELVFDDDVLIAQSAIFFAAGFETSSTTTSFCLYELAKNPGVQEKLRTEIKTTLKEYDGVITYEYIDSLQYLQQVLSETLRMYPTLPNLDRMYEAPDKKSKYSLAPYSNFEIPHGMPILIPTHAIHMDPKYYPEPTRFNPERFLDKSIYNNGTYMPFGLGPRKCIGDRFGLIQAKVALVNLLKDNFVTPSDKTPKIMKFDRKSVVIKSESGIWLNVVREVES